MQIFIYLYYNYIFFLFCVFNKKTILYLFSCHHGVSLNTNQHAIIYENEENLNVFRDNAHRRYFP